ncbi:MAG: YceD family protein [Kiritimatiellia bacterium]|jgi:uncharacterized metal-binding protein YceD (DUF177 family)
MILQTANLTETAASFSGEEPIDVFDWKDDGSEIVHPATPLRWSFDARVFGDELLIDGHASARFEGVCARCGRPIALELSEPLCFSRQLPEESAEVDLTSDLREAILLALPNHPVCDPECKGLCPRCGTSLAAGPCPCVDAVAAGAWDVLDRLISQKPSTQTNTEPSHGRTQTQKIKNARPHAPRTEKGRNRQREHLP